MGQLLFKRCRARRFPLVFHSIRNGIEVPQTRFLRHLQFLIAFGISSLLCSAQSIQLKKEDVKKTMEEMLAYHVEYKEFTPMLARRGIKIFLEQFDPEKVYLLSHEVRPFLNPKEEFLRKVIFNYQQDNLSEWKALNQLIQHAIARARAFRNEAEEQWVEEKGVSLRPERYSDYPSGESDLKKRIYSQVSRILSAEKKVVSEKKWTQDYQKKVWALWSRRFARQENSYLSVDSKAIQEHYLATHVLKAMAKSLDAHTAYFSPEEALEMRAALEKQFEGVGVVLREGVEGVLIHEMIRGGPAERSGVIAPGDLIVSIDGESVRGIPYEDVLKKMQGNGGNQVSLELGRAGSEDELVFYTVQLKREKIVMQDERVQYSAEPFAGGIIGKITLPSFYESGDGPSCDIDMRAALLELKKQGDLLGLVVDMRENSGGFLSQAVKVAGLFISSGVIVISKYSQGETQYLRDLDGRKYYEGPLIILTSKGSASAAEIVAQALQDYGTALIVGDERTYGKGTIQYQTVTDSDANSFFKVTVGRYYTVSGRSTQIDGVKADITVPTAYSLLHLGERYLEFPLKGDRVPSAYVDSLSDIAHKNQAWFKQNYLPNLQKKLSLWTQMLPQLKGNCAYRIDHNEDYSFFLKAIQMESQGQRFFPTAKENFGVEDLQMIESVNLIKDMLKKR